MEKAISLENYFIDSAISRKRVKERNYLPTEIQLAIDYLSDPLNAGIWILELDWAFNEGISSFVGDIIKNNPTVIKMWSNDPSLSNWQERLESITFYLRLFKSLMATSSTTALLDSYKYEYLDNEIIKNLDIADVKKNFKDALNLFGGYIDYPGFSPAVDRGIKRMKSGWFIADIAPRDIIISLTKTPFSNSKIPTKVLITSLDDAGLKILLEFFEKLGKVKGHLLYKVFSPEDLLLNPYVSIASEFSKYLDLSNTQFNYFKDIMNYIENESYSNCAGIGGLLLEELLSQMYEYFCRKPSPSLVTIGSMLPILENLVKGNSSVNVKGSKEVSEDLSSLDVTKIKVKDYTKQSIHLLKEYTDAKLLELSNKISSLGDINNIPYKSLIFPSHIYRHVRLIHQQRNNVSHRNASQLSNLDSIKILVSCVALTLWWSSAKKNVNWDKSCAESVKEFLSLVNKSV